MDCEALIMLVSPVGSDKQTANGGGDCSGTCDTSGSCRHHERDRVRLRSNSKYKALNRRCENGCRLMTEGHGDARTGDSAGKPGRWPGGSDPGERRDRIGGRGRHDQGRILILETHEEGPS